MNKQINEVLHKMSFQMAYLARPLGFQSHSYRLLEVLEEERLVRNSLHTDKAPCRSSLRRGSGEELGEEGCHPYLEPWVGSGRLGVAYRLEGIQASPRHHSLPQAEHPHLREVKVKEGCCLGIPGAVGRRCSVLVGEVYCLEASRMARPRPGLSCLRPLHNLHRRVAGRRCSVEAHCPGTLQAAPRYPNPSHPRHHSPLQAGRLHSEEERYSEIPQVLRQLSLRSDRRHSLQVVIVGGRQGVVSVTDCCQVAVVVHHYANSVRIYVSIHTKQ